VTAEQFGLDDAWEWEGTWKKWRPYLSDRQWGTVGEDDGDGWDYFSYDRARSRAHR
jgi:hypothetical protein